MSPVQASRLNLKICKRRLHCTSCDHLRAPNCENPANTQHVSGTLTVVWVQAGRLNRRMGRNILRLRKYMGRDAMHRVSYIDPPISSSL